MEWFANREDELSLVMQAVNALQDKHHLLQNPIVEFYGVEGIGKTTLLRQVEEICNDKHLSYVSADARRSTPYSFIGSTKALLEKDEPVVAILDSLDTATGEQLSEIEPELHDLIKNNRLFVVLASRTLKRFDETRTLANKLTIRPLKPLDRKSCIRYLDHFADSIPPETRDLIFEWTRGYPLAMNVMVEAIINKKLDPTSKLDQQLLIAILTEKVIEQGLLSKALSDPERNRIERILGVLSIPRRFNLVLMQDLIERFIPSDKFDSSLAYITLPTTINQVAHVLNWDMQRAGYCIDTPVRNLFLQKFKVEQPQIYLDIHRFLAQKNEAFAKEVSGPDHARYLREAFYHLAGSKDADLRGFIEQHIEQLEQEISQDSNTYLEFLDNFLQFYEEFIQDDELKEALGKNNSNFALSLMRRNFIRVYRYLHPKLRNRYLREFFSLTSYDLKTNDFSLIFEEGMRQIINEESRSDAIKLYNELEQDEELKTLLGQNFTRILSHIFDDLLEEG